MCHRCKQDNRTRFLVSWRRWVVRHIRLGKRKRATIMEIGEISPCSTPTRCFSRSFNSPRSSDYRQDSHNNVGALSSIRSYGTPPKLRTIAIAVKAHKKMRQEPFAYAFNHLVEQKNCKVVVICCLSRLRDDMGVDRIIDDKTFGGLSKKMLEAAITTQKCILNHFLKVFRERLDQRGVQLDIRIKTGPKSEDIMVQAAKALHPHWVVFDVSFARHQKKIQGALECNLVMVKKHSKSLILRLTPTYLGPVDQIHDQLSQEFVDPVLDGSSISLTEQNSSWASWFSSKSTRNSITSTSKSSTKSVRQIEAELKAKMAKPLEVEDYQEYNVQL